ncbi:MAG: SDR family NAD(P)-dependent oxidoreductase [Hyphomonas sp.]|nr:SDR family NAD(P)-dependent oxidoreductase [Hyphomonas sp.]MCB9962896.1 SDR family NAD(P)-dependent oxidoreductase [Hyphomonas sp.]MCB9971341.1 SDR family NAD(P)-dependent oxidoreductase [Hyphomonas sp.]
MTDTILVTGASGYLGRNIVRDFVARGIAVRGLARSDSSAKAVEELGATPVRGDVMDVPSLRAAMEGVTSLIHAAADTNHGRTTKAQEQTNLQGTRNVYETAHAAGVKRAVHISTEAVLMDGRPIVNADETWPLPAKPAGGYSRTKGGAERIALAANGNGMDVVVVRPRFVWGRDDTSALPQLVEAAKAGRLAWFGGGTYLTSTTHIANVVEGVRLALEKGRGGEVYFLTDGDDVPFREWMTELLATQSVDTSSVKSVPRGVISFIVNTGELLAGLSGGAISGPLSKQEYATVGNTVTLNIDKARRELGYVPVMTRAEGLAELKALAAKA